MIKRIKYFVFLIFVFMGFKSEVFAGSLSIWASSSNVTVGSKVTVSVKASNLAGTFNVTSSDSSVLSGSVTGEWMENDTYTFTFTAKKAGTAKVTVLATDVADFDTNGDFSGAKTVTIKVVAKSSSSGGSGSSSGGTTADVKKYSSDNSLKSLSVDGYEIGPTFNKDTLEYSLTVDQSVEKIKVSASTNHDKASVSGAGEISLANGENTIEVKVTAENGNQRVYKIIVTVSDLNPIVVKVNNKDFTIVKKNNNLVPLLDYYDEISLTISDQAVVAYENTNTKVILVLLKDSDNNIKYYVYDAVKNMYTEYRYISLGGVTLQLTDADYKLDFYTKYDLKVQELTIDYYKIKGSHKVGLIYGTNVKTGNTGYYVYDQTEETLSKYYDEEVKVCLEQASKYKNYLMILIGGIAFVSIILIALSLKKGSNSRKNRYKI